MENSIKIIDSIGLTFSILCLIASVFDKDISESMAWSIVCFYYIKDLFLKK